MRGDQPTVAGQGLGAELRALRKERTLSTRKVAQMLDWAQSKISKIETGKQGVTPADVASFLAVLGVTGHERDQLVAKAEKVDEPGFVETQVGLSRESRTLIQLEDHATHIFNFEPLVIPGLFQVPEYTRSVMRAAGIPEAHAEVRVASRMARQAILSREAAPQVDIVLDEGAIQRRVLGPRLLARQLRHVCETAEYPNVEIRVLPLSLGTHTGLDGSFGILNFRTRRPVAYLEHKYTGTFLEERYETDLYQTEATRLKEVALPPNESVDFVANIAKDLDQS